MYLNLFGTRRTPCFEINGAPGGGGGSVATGTPAASSSTPSGSPGGATPPASAGSVGQAGSPQPNATDSFTHVDPATLPPELQPIYKSLQADYTKKRQEDSEYRRAVEQTGRTTAELQQDLADLNYIRNNPMAVIEQFIREDPTRFQALAQAVGPQAAMAALMGGIMPQQQQASPYEALRNITDPVEFAMAMDDIISKKAEQLVDSRFKTVQEPFMAHQAETDRAAISGQIKNYATDFPDLGIQEQAVWDVIKAEGIPLELLKAKPNILEWCITRSAGGLKNLAQTLATKGATNFQAQVQRNAASTAPLPSGTPIAATDSKIVPDTNSRRKAVQQRLALEALANK